MELVPIRGRGVAANPRNRFERLEIEPDPEFEDPDDPEPWKRTQYLRDASRSALTRNNSPDVGFEYSVNPYRGCEHGCAYCLGPDTPVLHSDLVWRPLGDIRIGDELAAFDEYPEAGRTRKFRKAVLERIWRWKRPTVRLITRHSEVLTTANHRWLQAGRFRWSRTDQLTRGRRLCRMPVVASGPEDEEYRAGYVAGISLRDATFRYEPGWRSLPPSYCRGFVAGFFDAEGHGGTSLRMSQVDHAVLRRVEAYAAAFGFRFRLEDRAGRASTLRLVGDLTERLRFLSVFRPAFSRRTESLYGRQLTLPPDPVVAVEPGPVTDVMDIQTSTRTFYAAGLATHNCYARPTHEYLGFSAGLDFESKIMVKVDAPALLRQELASPRWRPQVIAMSGVTDPYQPVERKLRITRGCLEVLAEFRNPVAIVTKNHLVTRDIDLLAELAAHDAAAVNVSVTSLDPELQRVMEPRTSIPARRLAAIGALAAAGIPVRAMVAPVVPGLTDHEIPRILEAVAEAGARGASFIMLRLPYGVKDLFAQWLAAHFPDRKEKVLNRIRDLRGGKLNETGFGARMRGSGPFAEHVRAMFEVTCRKLGLNEDRSPLSTAAFRRPVPPGGQLGLFAEEPPEEEE
jgi:DNA repair photolyase